MKNGWLFEIFGQQLEMGDKLKKILHKSALF